MQEDGMGCEVCNATPDDGAVRADLPFEVVRRLHHSSHSGFYLCKCVNCGQPYLEQFHEIVDWKDGDDDIWVRWEPLTAGEVGRLNEQFPGEDYSGSECNELFEYMHFRRRLVRDFKGEYYWSDNPWDAGDMLPPG